MQIPKGVKTLFHSIAGVVIALIVFYFGLSLLRQYAPTAFQGPINTLGTAVNGSAWNFQ